MPRSFNKIRTLFYVVVVLLGETFASVWGDEVLPETQYDNVIKQYALKDGRSVFVFDGAVTESYLISLRLFMSATDNWRYVLHDDRSKAPLFDDKNGIPWKSWKDPIPLKKTRVYSELNKLVQTANAKANGNSEDVFEINEIYAALIRRGDRTRIHNETGTEEKSYSLMIYDNIVWRKNAYGETLFYDQEGEIFATIRPKFGRIVVWDSSIPYVVRPPSIAQLTTMSVIFATFSKNNSVNKKKLEYFHNFMNELSNPPSLSDSVSGFKDTYSKEDLSKHMTMRRTNKKSHFVAVFDGLFTELPLNDLRTWVVKYGTYYYDGSIDVDSDNVQWIAGINVNDFVKTSFWPVIRSMAGYVSNTSSWYPYDVACNLIRSYDHTRFHLDTSYEVEKEMTFLLYLSPNWTAADYGETAFMETNDNSANNEYVAEVVPMFGRAVIFDGNFPHSARPPSVTHYSARYTLAVKLAYTKKFAIEKTFTEEFRHEENLAHILGFAKKLMTMPEVAVVENKLSAVAEYLSSRQLQKILSEPMEEHTREDDGNSQSVLESLDDVVVNEELDDMISSLSYEDRKQVLRMVKHHKYKEKLQVPNTVSIDTLENPVFAPERRQMTIQNWKKVVGDDADMYSDYQELYLKQRDWFGNYIEEQFLTML